MRHGLLVPAIVIVIALGLVVVWFSGAYDHAASAALTDDARLAIDVRCENQHGKAQRDCRRLLTKLFLAGSLDPDKTLRSYCDEVKHARWGGSLPPPPEVCVQRYGGWEEG